MGGAGALTFPAVFDGKRSQDPFQGHVMPSTYDTESLRRLIIHCRMFLYASRGSPVIPTNKIADYVFQFTWMHLLSTMFIIKDKKSDTRGGFFYRVLDPMGLTYLLESLEKILDSPVGSTTMQTFIQKKRNKSATHGDLSFESFPREIRQIASEPTSIDQFYELCAALEGNVFQLTKKLESILKKQDGLLGE